MKNQLINQQLLQQKLQSLPEERRIQLIMRAMDYAANQGCSRWNCGTRDHGHTGTA